MSDNLVEMELREIQIVQDMQRTQIIVLGEKYGERTFPIFIGLNEALAMDMAAHGERTPRPLTHDLVLNVVAELGGVLERVLVTKLENETFFGALEVRSAGGQSVRVDSRPSDAIVLAVKTGVPIFVDEQVLLAVGRPPADEGETAEPDEDEPF